MDPLSISALLFTLVALEVSATIKKSTGEGSFAFLAPRIRSSKQKVLSTKLEELLKIKDHRTVQTVLSEYGIIDKGEKNLNQLEKMEHSITTELDNHYNLILHYLTEDLKIFFNAYKTLWEIENLKTVLCSTYEERLEDDRSIRRDVNHLELKSTENISKIPKLDKTLKDATKNLPSELSSQITIEEDQTFQELLFSLDLAAFEYLEKKKEEIASRKVQLTWNIIAGVYETENVTTIGRLKHFNIPPNIIKRFLFPVRKKLEDSDVTHLLEAEDYSDFLRILKETPYKESIPQGEITPMELERSIKRRGRKVNWEEMLQENAINTVTNFLLTLEDQYDIIREASFFVLLKEGERGV